MKIIEYMQYISLSAPVAALAGIVLCFIGRRIPTQPARMLLIYLSTALAAEMLTRYLGLVAPSKYNLYLFSIFAFVELVIIGIMYLRFLIGLKVSTTTIILSAIAMIMGVGAIYLDHLFNVKLINAFSKVISNLSVITFCLMFMWREIKADRSLFRPYINLSAWFVGYYSLSAVVFLSMNFLINASVEIVIYFWGLYLLLNVLFYLLITRFLWVHGKMRRPLPFG